MKFDSDGPPPDALSDCEAQPAVRIHSSRGPHHLHDANLCSENAPEVEHEISDPGKSIASPNRRRHTLETRNFQVIPSTNPQEIASSEHSSMQFYECDVQRLTDQKFILEEHQYIPSFNNVSDFQQLKSRFAEDRLNGRIYGRLSRAAEWKIPFQVRR